MSFDVLVVVPEEISILGCDSGMSKVDRNFRTFTVVIEQRAVCFWVSASCGG